MPHPAEPEDASSHAHEHSCATPHAPKRPAASPARRLSVLAWPAWLRVLAVLPVVAVLWLAVAWANMEVVAW